MSYSSFIPNFHFRPASEKMTAEWFDEANKYCWYNAGNRNLLENKNLVDIRGYATGNYSMIPYKKMFKSIKNKMDAADRGEFNPNDRFNTNSIMPMDGFVQTPILPAKLNAAEALLNKIPLEATAIALDGLATIKKQEDINFLKNKPALQAQLNAIAEQMQVGNVDLGTTRHSAVPFSNSPYGLDLNEPDELQVFVDLLQKLSVEAALETANMAFWEIKNGEQIRALETRDQFWYGISAHLAFESATTLLPDLEYVFPGDITVPYSNLKDYEDNPFRFLNKRVTPLELMNLFGNDICSTDELVDIITAPTYGYCACNGITDMTSYAYDKFGTCKVDLVYCMIKSIDFVGVAPLNKKSKFTYVVTDPDEEYKCTNKTWAQNTYCAWWLRNTKYYFGIEKLGFAHRTIGQESLQNFPLHIFKSQERSAVENCIGENKKAQVADIKMQVAIIKSQPRGKYVDLKYIRSALEGLIKENSQWTQQDLINLFMEQNYMIGDTDGFEGKNEGQFRPFQDIPGGVNIVEIEGYLRVIADANLKTSQYTGINENIIGQKAEELVRNNNALINAGINALDYVSKALQAQYQKLFNNWSYIIQNAIKRGGKSKEAIINLIGSKKVSLIEALDDLALHTIGLIIKLNQTEKIQQDFTLELNRLKINNVINTVDEYMLEGITNPKDRMALLAVKYKQWEKRTERQRREDFAQQQAIVQAQGENLVNAQREKGAQETQHIYAQGDVDAHKLQLANDLGIRADQMNFLGKRALQQDRGRSQLEKSVKTLETKQELKNQEAFTT